MAREPNEMTDIVRCGGQQRTRFRLGGMCDRKVVYLGCRFSATDLSGLIRATQSARPAQGPRNHVPWRVERVKRRL